MRYTQTQIENALQMLVEFHGMKAAQRIVDQGLSISDPNDFDAIAEILLGDFGIDPAKGVSAPTSFRGSLNREDDAGAHVVAEIDSEEIFATYNANAKRHARGKDRIPCPDGESLRDVKDE